MFEINRLRNVICTCRGLCFALAVISVMSTASHAQQDEEVKELETVTVTGSRRVIQNAIDIKRNATAIVDGLSASDIGDLPALSIGEALESITGAASHRENGGATEISIRGLGPFLSSTVFNGREATNGSGDRSVNFSQFPSELITKIAIYKTQDASLIEGGVAGQIQLETLKPLDFGQERYQVDIKTNLNPDQQDVSDSMAGEYGYRVTGSYVDQFSFDNGNKLGVAVGVQVSDISQPEQEVRSNSPTGSSHRACLADPNDATVDPTDNREPDRRAYGRGFSNASRTNDDCEDYAGRGDSVNYGGDNGTGYDTRVDVDSPDPTMPFVPDLGRPFVLIPNERSYRQNDTHDTRNSVFAALQYQPSPQWDLNFDAQWSERTQAEDRHDFGFVNFRRNTRNVTYDSLSITSQGATTTFATDTMLEARGETYDRTEEYIGVGFDVSFTPQEGTKFLADLSFSETTRTEHQFLIRTQTDDRYRVSWERHSSDAGSFTIRGANPNDHSLFINRYRARIDSDLDRRNTVTALRFDIEQAVQIGALNRIDTGVRISSQEYYSLAGGRTNLELRNDRDSPGNQTSVPQQDGVTAITNLNTSCRLPFQEGDEFLASIRKRPLFTIVDSNGRTVSTTNSWASFDTVCMVKGVVEAFGAETVFPKLVPDSSTIDVTEDTTAVYVQANYETLYNDVPIRGKIGVRILNTQVESIGLRTELSINRDDPQNLHIVDSGRLIQTNVGKHDYTTILPSFSFVADIADNRVIRGGLFRGLSRADPADMGYSRSFVQVNDDLSGITNVQDLISEANGSGNPAYDPLVSWNYDVSFEWYPDEDTILALGLYYKNFVGGFQNVRKMETFHVDGENFTVPITVTETNKDRSTLVGIEVTASHRFKNLPEHLDGLGFKLSTNLANSDFEFQDSNYGVRGFVDLNGQFDKTNEAIVKPGNIPGFSELTISGQLYYQKGDFDGSIIYKYRSKYFQPYTSNGTRLRYVGDVGVWEARASYEVSEEVELTFSAINIFDAPKTQYFYTDDNLGEVNVYGPRVFFGARARF